MCSCAKGSTKQLFLQKESSFLSRRYRGEQCSLATTASTFRRCRSHGKSLPSKGGAISWRGEMLGSRLGEMFRIRMHGRHLPLLRGRGCFKEGESPRQLPQLSSPLAASDYTTNFYLPSEGGVMSWGGGCFNCC